MRARAEWCRECEAAGAIEHCAAPKGMESAESGVVNVKVRIEKSAETTI